MILVHPSIVVAETAYRRTMFSLAVHKILIDLLFVILLLMRSGHHSVY